MKRVRNLLFGRKMEKSKTNEYESEDEPGSQGPSQGDDEEGQIRTWPVNLASSENDFYYVGFSPIPVEPEDRWQDVEELIGDVQIQSLTPTQGESTHETEGDENGVELVVGTDTENVYKGCTCEDCVKESGYDLQAGVDFQPSKRCIRPDRTQVYTPKGEILTVDKGILENIEGRRLECIIRIIPSPFDGHIVLCRFFKNDTQFVRHSLFRIYFEQELLDYYGGFKLISEEKKEAKLDSSGTPSLAILRSNLSKMATAEDKTTDITYDKDTEDNQRESDDDTDFEVNNTEGKDSDSSSDDEERTSEDSHSMENYSDELSSDSDKISSDSDSDMDTEEISVGESDSEDDERIVDLSKL